MIDYSFTLQGKRLDLAPWNNGDIHMYEWLLTCLRNGRRTVTLVNHTNTELVGDTKSCFKRCRVDIVAVSD